MDKIQEASTILESLNLPKQQRNQISSLALLALCNIRPGVDWERAERRSMILADIFNYISNFYQIDYKSGTRESLRKEAINPFVEFGLIDKNPDEPDLPTTSPKTHYAISSLALNTIKKFGSPEWTVAVENFNRYKNENSNYQRKSMLLRKLKIESYKSIVQDEIELGRFNVFIGANGCGKTNILEAVATVGAEKGRDLNFDGLYSRGVRMARPDLMMSSFLKENQKSSIEISLTFENEGELEETKCSLVPTNIDDAYSKWINLSDEEIHPEYLLNFIENFRSANPTISAEELLSRARIFLSYKQKNGSQSDDLLSDYAIYDLNTKSLRGISPADSKKTPLGINGEGLDLLISSLTKNERQLLNKCLSFFDWLGEIVADKDDKLKLVGLKPGRSISTLYFKDRFMQKNNNTFSAENSNEGVLHVLFYLALFISDKTPKLFAIDNIETALNPRLCQILIAELAKLSKETERQVLITTHSPAILDGLNLLDDDQRLFEVFRDSEGRTKTRRIKFKHDLSDKKFKLSDMWLKGLLGAVPKNF